MCPEFSASVSAIFRKNYYVRPFVCLCQWYTTRSNLCLEVFYCVCVCVCVHICGSPLSVYLQFCGPQMCSHKVLFWRTIVDFTVNWCYFSIEEIIDIFHLTKFRWKPCRALPFTIICILTETFMIPYPWVCRTMFMWMILCCMFPVPWLVFLLHVPADLLKKHQRSRLGARGRVVWI